VFTRSRALIPLSVLLIANAGFAMGFVACLHLKGARPSPLREQELVQSGNAPPVVRTAIVEKLHALQEGYARRDPKQVESLTQSLFPQDGDVLILGTDGGVREWVRGAPDARRFIEQDWRLWGDLHFDVDHAIVWSSGTAAWVATIGVVRWQRSERPVRFTAVLTRENDRWVFRQMHFQWDDNEPAASDLLRPQTYLNFLSDALR
jgi:hypothetical protein